MSSPAAKSPYAGHRFPAEVISHAVWLYFRFPLGMRMVEEMLAARGLIVSHETARRWALKFGQEFANRIRRRLVITHPPLVRGLRRDGLQDGAENSGVRREAGGVDAGAHVGLALGGHIAR
jgi:putative transposase